MSPKESLEERKSEFQSHIWNHADDEFQTGFDSAPAFDSETISLLELIRDMIINKQKDNVIIKSIEPILRKNPGLINKLLQISGLTRNKPITDLKASLGSKGIKVPSTPQSLISRSDIWEHAGIYILSRLRPVLTPIAVDNCKHIGPYQALNIATWPGWIRQERAKRQGHEAEARLARMLSKLGIPFEPKEKEINPLCRDAQLHGHSFDLVVPSIKKPKVVFKSTVHTSNIGQYGESKDHLEISEAADVVSRHMSGAGTILFALADGIGFMSNTAGRDGVLTKADEFCQFNTLWKAAVVCAASINKRITVELSDPEDHKKFLARYKDYVTIKKTTKNVANDPGGTPVEAGEACVYWGYGS
jgi:hypothetical protein